MLPRAHVHPPACGCIGKIIRQLLRDEALIECFWFRLRCVVIPRRHVLPSNAGERRYFHGRAELFVFLRTTASQPYVVRVLGDVTIDSLNLTFLSVSASMKSLFSSSLRSPSDEGGLAMLFDMRRPFLAPASSSRGGDEDGVVDDETTEPVSEDCQAITP